MHWQEQKLWRWMDLANLQRSQKTQRASAGCLHDAQNSLKTGAHGNLSQNRVPRGGGLHPRPGVEDFQGQCRLLAHRAHMRAAPYVRSTRVDGPQAAMVHNCALHRIKSHEGPDHAGTAASPLATPRAGGLQGHKAGSQNRDINKILHQCVKVATCCQSRAPTRARRMVACA